MAANIEYWVGESLRRKEVVVVIIRNETTGEYVRTSISPEVIAGLTLGAIIEKGAQDGKR